MRDTGADPYPCCGQDQIPAGDGGGALRDLDDRLHDAVALDEISLYGDVLSAVAASDRRLTDDEIDAVLGLGGLDDQVS